MRNVWYIYRNEYCQILDFLRNITVKSSATKTIFFKTLHQRLNEVPSHLIANRLLHLLLSRFVLIDPTAVEIFLPHLLTPKSGIDHILTQCPSCEKTSYAVKGTKRLMKTPLSCPYCLMLYEVLFSIAMPDSGSTILFDNYEQFRHKTLLNPELSACKAGSSLGKLAIGLIPGLQVERLELINKYMGKTTNCLSYLIAAWKPLRIILFNDTE